MRIAFSKLYSSATAAVVAWLQPPPSPPTSSPPPPFDIEAVTAVDLIVVTRAMDTIASRSCNKHCLSSEREREREREREGG
jgi:hypothetical protein